MITVENRAVFTEQLRDRRQRGRPRSAVPIVVVSVKVPEAVYDAYCRFAADQGVSVHRAMKTALELQVRPRHS